MTRVLVVSIAHIVVFTVLAGLACGVGDYDLQRAGAIAESSTSAGAASEGPGNQSNGRISITNDEASLRTRLRITSQDIRIDPVTTTPASARPTRQGRYETSRARSQATDSQPAIRLVLFRPAVGCPPLDRRGPPRIGLLRGDSQPDLGGRRAPSFLTAQSLVLTLVAEVAPPIVDGRALQATSVTIKGKYAYVSYNMRGEPHIGAIDVIEIKMVERPKLVSQAIFRDSDIHPLTFEGSKVYAAQATDDPDLETPAAFEIIGIRKGKFVLDDNQRVSLPSFAGTSVAVSGDRVYVTSGDTGGLSVFRKKDLEPLGHVELQDARWVDVDGKEVVVVQCTPGRISVVDKKTLVLTDVFMFEGSDVPESKSTVQVIGGRAFVAAGAGGTQVVDLKTGRVVAAVPRPVVTGIDPARTVTNAVSADGKLVFISNGEAGVYVAQSPKSFKNTDGPGPLDLVLLGKLRFQNLQSVNHVVYKGEVLFVAAGLGGLKIVKVED